jgi:hypothetical protein
MKDSRHYFKVISGAEYFVNCALIEYSIKNDYLWYVNQDCKSCLSLRDDEIKLVKKIIKDKSKGTALLNIRHYDSFVRNIASNTLRGVVFKMEEI